VRSEAILISGAIRRAATLVNGGIPTSVLHFQQSHNMGRSAQMRVNRGEKFISGATERLTAVGDIVPLIPSIKKGNVNKAMVTMLSLETVKDMFLAATVGQSSSNVNQLSSLTSSFSLAHSRKMLGVSGCRMNCNKYMFK